MVKELFSLVFFLLSCKLSLIILFGYENLSEEKKTLLHKSFNFTEDWTYTKLRSFCYSKYLKITRKAKSILQFDFSMIFHENQYFKSKEYQEQQQSSASKTIWFSAKSFIQISSRNTVEWKNVLKSQCNPQGANT